MTRTRRALDQFSELCRIVEIETGVIQDRSTEREDECYDQSSYTVKCAAGTIVISILLPSRDPNVEREKIEARLYLDERFHDGEPNYCEAAVTLSCPWSETWQLSTPEDHPSSEVYQSLCHHLELDLLHQREMDWEPARHYVSAFAHILIGINRTYAVD